MAIKQMDKPHTKDIAQKRLFPKMYEGIIAKFPQSIDIFQSIDMFSVGVIYVCLMKRIIVGLKY